MKKGVHLTGMSRLCRDSSPRHCHAASLRAALATVTLVVVTLLPGCSRWQKGGLLDDSAAFGFPRVLEHARRAAAAYETDDVIKERFGAGTRLEISDLRGVDVKAFVEVDGAARVQWVVVRGTANLANVKLDAEWHKDAEARLGVPIHRGFYDSALAVYGFARPRLDPSFETRVTGHSLGGAVAAVLLMMFHEDGLHLGRAMTFGQPKVTNAAGVARYRDLPLLRFVNHDDPVPLLPPEGFGQGAGVYRHFGAEVWLEDQGGFRFFPEHRAEAGAVTGFWRHLGEEDVAEHFIARYIANLEKQLQLFPHRAKPSDGPPTS